MFQQPSHPSPRQWCLGTALQSFHLPPWVLPYGAEADWLVGVWSSLDRLAQSLFSLLRGSVGRARTLIFSTPQKGPLGQDLEMQLEAAVLSGVFLCHGGGPWKWGQETSPSLKPAGLPVPTVPPISSPETGAKAWVWETAGSPHLAKALAGVSSELSQETLAFGIIGHLTAQI